MREGPAGQLGDVAGHAPSGFPAEEAARWISAHTPTLRPPLTFDRLAAGRSNPTYRVTGACGASLVLRHAPIGPREARAHDVGREYRAISGLAPTSIPVPEPIALCDDEEVIGAPFYLMSYVPGRVMHLIEDGLALPEQHRMKSATMFVDVLADLHRQDFDALGMGRLGRREGYLPRQIRLWYDQFQRLAPDPVPLIDELHRTFMRDLPAEPPTTLVHGDYRYGNAVVDDEGRPLAILDWELCTLGDPMVDLGLLLMQWYEPGETRSYLVSTPTQAPGFPSRRAAAEHYAKASGRDLTALNYYYAFGFWRMACAQAGVWARYAAGRGGGEAIDPEVLRTSISELAEFAATAFRDGP